MLVDCVPRIVFSLSSVHQNGLADLYSLRTQSHSLRVALVSYATHV